MDIYSHFCALDTLQVFATAGGLGAKAKDWFFGKVVSALMPRKDEYLEGVRKRTGGLKGNRLNVYVAVDGAPPAVFSPFHLISQAFAHDHVHPCFLPISPIDGLLP
jgi:hypothetical protein